MVKLILLKRPKEGTSREALYEYLGEVHGPLSTELPGVDYELYTQVEPEEEGYDGDQEFYEDTRVPADPDTTQFNTLEIHDFDSMEELVEAHSSDKAAECEEKLSAADVVDFQEEAAFVVREEEID